MNFEYAHLLPEDFNKNAKVWIYQSSRMFGLSEALQLESLLFDFVEEWESHGAAVKGYANLLFGQFIVFMADDTDATICGRSIDSIARFVKDVEQKFSISLLDRQSLAFIVKDKIQLLPLTQLKYGIENKFISPETLYFNNLVTDKKSFLTNWIIPAKNSWLAAKLDFIQTT
jgi:hypothetical protein